MEELTIWEQHTITLSKVREFCDQRFMRILTKTDRKINYGNLSSVQWLCGRRPAFLVLSLRLL